MQSSDGELVIATRHGASESFALLVQRYDRRVRKLIAQELGLTIALEELVHHTFYLAFKKLAQLEDPGRFEGWVSSIALSVAREHVREQARRRSRESGVSPPELACEPRAASFWIWEEVAALGGPFAEVLLLRYRQGLSYREMGERLGLTESTIRGRIYVARKALRARLAVSDRGRDFP